VIAERVTANVEASRKVRAAREHARLMGGEFGQYLRKRLLAAYRERMGIAVDEWIAEQFSGPCNWRGIGSDLHLTIPQPTPPLIPGLPIVLGPDMQPGDIALRYLPPPPQNRTKRETT
jgi:hypothetical protein